MLFELLATLLVAISFNSSLPRYFQQLATTHFINQFTALYSIVNMKAKITLSIITVGLSTIPGVFGAVAAAPNGAISKGKQSDDVSHFLVNPEHGTERRSPGLPYTPVDEAVRKFQQEIQLRAAGPPNTPVDGPPNTPVDGPPNTPVDVSFKGARSPGPPNTPVDGPPNTPVDVAFKGAKRDIKDPDDGDKVVARAGGLKQRSAMFKKGVWNSEKSEHPPTSKDHDQVSQNHGGSGEKPPAPPPPPPKGKKDGSLRYNRGSRLGQGVRQKTHVLVQLKRHNTNWHV